MPEKRPLPLFRVFARGYMHAFGAHLPLEKCKKPRTGCGFLQIDEELGQRLSPIQSVLVQFEKPEKSRLPKDFFRRYLARAPFLIYDK